MSQDTRTPPAMTIGLDVSDRLSSFCVLNAVGDIVEEGRVLTTPHGIAKWFGKREPSRVAIEVGTHSPWMLRVLLECGHQVLVANPRKLRLIYENESKSDRLDARMLARLARVDPQLLHPVRHRGLQAQVDLAVLRARDIVVQARTAAIGHVRGALKSFGVRVPGGTASTFHRRAALVLPQELEPAIGPLLRNLAALTEQIQGYDRLVETIAEEHYPETWRLRQVCGVGALTALCFVLTIEDPHRFRHSRTVGAYLGLRPRRDQSGRRDPQLHISKTGSPELRRLLVQAAHYILGPFGPDTDLRRWGQALKARGGKGAAKRAIVAVARKLAVLLHRLWLSGEVYDPLRHSHTSEEHTSPGAAPSMGAAKQSA